jgi:hypothetical protein
MKVLHNELPASGIEVPQEDKLRELVRCALRSARRFIKHYGRGTARSIPGLLRERILNFVTARCREPERPPIVKNSSHSIFVKRRSPDQEDHNAQH